MTDNFILRRVLASYQPVFCTAQHLYLFRKGHLYRTDHDCAAPTRFARIPGDRPLMSLAPRLLERVFRTAIQCAAQCGENTLLLARRSRIWRVDLTSGAVALDHAASDGRGVLALSRITSPTTGIDWLVFGEYFHNPGQTEVRLWRRRCDTDGPWEVAAAFPAGEIDHVHGIHQLSDGRVFVLAGDFGDAAGVWETDGDFGALRPVMRGEQRFRACWWFERNGQVVYGTDSQFEVNKLLMLRPGEQAGTVVAELPGSCIYHGRSGTDLVFSTTVEPGESSGSFVRDALSRTAGPGITGDPAIFHYSDRLTKLFSSPKDGWPSRLGQFGTFMFPAGIAPADRVYAYGVAVKGHDGDCLVFAKS